ncbi:MAG: molecular chaperone DnaK, partial [Lachnospiraceae bacterium]|nr:molecular chaperone DnaK [Lachnospiraceae bacterium]
SMSDSDIDEIKTAKVKLEEDSQALFSKLYEQAQAAGAGMGGQAGPDMGSAGADMNQDSSQDDVVDGDYREV